MEIHEINEDLVEKILKINDTKSSSKISIKLINFNQD